MESDWTRYQGKVEYRSKTLVPGYRLHFDKNEVVKTGSDSIINTAMNFMEHQVFLQSNDTLPFAFFGHASWRKDDFPVKGKMMPHTSAFTTQVGLKNEFGPHDVEGSFTYRKMTLLSEALPQETSIMGRLDYLSHLADNHIRNEFSYAIGNGRELKKEFIYLPVPTGDGTHTWRDDNEDGIQQINEFYLAINPEEKNFIKIFVPTDDYILAYTSLFNYRLNARFPDTWRNERGLKSFLQKISNNTSWNLEKKVSAKDFFSRVSPITKGIANDNLIAVKKRFRSSLFFNRSSPRYGMEASLFDSQHKQLLTGGFEDLAQRDWRINSRLNFNPRLNLKVSLNSGSRYSSSDFLENRNFKVEQYSLGHEITWQPSANLRGSGNYKYTHKINSANREMNETASLNQFSFKMRYAKAIKTTVNAQLKYTYINYNGLPNSPIGYEMLQALTLGDNYIWKIDFLQKIGEGLQLNMTYEGRDSEGLHRMVHTGRMQVSALF